MRVRGESGVSTSQLAVLMPAVLFVIMLIVQYGLWFHAQQASDEAAHQAVTAAALAGGTEADGYTAAVTFLAATSNLNHPQVIVVRGPQTVVATVTATAPRLVPFTAFTVSSHAEAAVEQFLPETQR